MRATVRYNVFWEALRDRVDTALMQEILGGTGRVYRPGDVIPDHEEPANGPWGRVILMPVRFPWFGLEDVSQSEAMVRILAKVEFRDYREEGYDVLAPLYAAHGELYDRLDQWSPGDVGTNPATMVHVRQPLFRAFPPDPAPLYDDGLSVYTVSAEYRCELTPTVGR